MSNLQSYNLIKVQKGPDVCSKSRRTCRRYKNLLRDHDSFGFMQSTSSGQLHDSGQLVDMSANLHSPDVIKIEAASDFGDDSETISVPSLPFTPLIATTRSV